MSDYPSYDERLENWKESHGDEFAIVLIPVTRNGRGGWVAYVTREGDEIGTRSEWDGDIGHAAAMGENLWIKAMDAAAKKACRE